MKLKALILLLAVGFQASACQTSQRSLAAEHHHGSLPQGGRMSLHGMVIYGSSGHYFIDHIPMLMAPHDFQFIASVKIKDASGSLVLKNLSQEAFTLKPSSHFSLNDLIKGDLKGFEGDVHIGSFEQGGKIVHGLERVKIEITQIKLARQLPAESTSKYFEVSDRVNTYQSSIITAENNEQKIKNQTTNQTLWCVVGPDFFEDCSN